MGTCSAKNKDIEKLTKKEFKYEIPYKDHLPKLFWFSNTVYFDYQGISAIKAMIIKNKKDVVVKKIKKNSWNETLFQFEVLAFKKLQHPNLISCMDYF